MRKTLLILTAIIAFFPLLNCQPPAAVLQPIAYGSVTSLGAIYTGSGNFSVNHTPGSGVYDVTVSGYTASADITTVTATLHTSATGAAVIYWDISGSDISFTIRNAAGAVIDLGFSFTVW